MLAQINLTHTYNFDIDEIANIKVLVTLENQRYLRIKARNIDRCIGECDTDSVNLYCKLIPDHSPDRSDKIFTETHLEKIIDILNNLKFSTLNGCFYLDGDKNNTTILELEDKTNFHKKLNSNIKVKKLYDECSVCFEPTTCKGKCNHYCCYTCWDKIEQYFCDDCKENDYNGDCNDELCGNQRCPMCRDKLFVN